MQHKGDSLSDDDEKAPLLAGESFAEKRIQNRTAGGTHALPPVRARRSAQRQQQGSLVLQRNYLTLVEQGGKKNRLLRYSEDGPKRPPLPKKTDWRYCQALNAEYQKATEEHELRFEQIWRQVRAEETFAASARTIVQALKLTQLEADEIVYAFQGRDYCLKSFREREIRGPPQRFDWLRVLASTFASQKRAAARNFAANFRRELGGDVQLKAWFCELAEKEEKAEEIEGLLFELRGSGPCHKLTTERSEEKRRSEKVLSENFHSPPDGFVPFHPTEAELKPLKEWSAEEIELAMYHCELTPIEFFSTEFVLQEDKLRKELMREQEKTGERAVRDDGKVQLKPPGYLAYLQHQTEEQQIREKFADGLLDVFEENGVISLFNQLDSREKSWIGRYLEIWYRNKIR